MKERLGGRLRIALSGGAPLAPDVLRFFHSLDILILEGYGLTECTTAASANQTTLSGSARSGKRCRAGS